LEKQQLIYKIGLSLLRGIGPKKAGQLISKLGGVEPIFTERLTTLKKETGINSDLLKQMGRESALLEAERQLEYIAKHKINVHFYLDNNYPRRLRQCADAPLIMYSKGKFDPNPVRSVSVVGTRTATEYGKSLCEELINSMKGSDIQVVSGMAYGIDIIAHQNCVKRDIETVGVLGHGLDRIYPSVHKRTAEMMLERGGILTEFLPGTKPDRENFPMRNRIVAGMTDATIVVESRASGGSLITADMALDYNKDVFAYPGNIGQIHSEGCNLIIQKDKARLITSGSDFMDYMGWGKSNDSTRQQRIQFDQLNQEETQLVEILGDQGLHIDVIAMQLKKPVSSISVLLLTLEIKGIIKSLPGNRYGMSLN
jgi:DNA processing protein